MKEIQLTQGQFALVDDEDYEREFGFEWYAWWNKETQSFYAVRRYGTRAKKLTEYLHRKVMQTPKGMICDHKNHDTLDNRKENLRNCTPSQSLMNTRIHTNNTTGFKNISIHRDKYRVTIRANRTTVFDREFFILEDAIAARDEAVKKYHGEFANKD